MQRDDALKRLKEVADAARQRGATGLFLYGSTARDDARADSDLDLFIDYDPDSRFNALHLVAMKAWLEDELGTRVELSTRTGLHPMLRTAIEASAIRIF